MMEKPRLGNVIKILLFLHVNQKFPQSIGICWHLNLYHNGVLQQLVMAADQVEERTDSYLEMHYYND